MDSDQYIEILKGGLHKSARKLGLRRGWLFQQDNDPKHTSKKTKAYFRSARIRVLDWPSRNPDLNPIENIWG